MRYSIKFVASAKKSVPFGLGMSKKFHDAVWKGGCKRQWHDIGIKATEYCLRTRSCMIDVEASDAAELSFKQEVCQSLVDYIWQASNKPFTSVEVFETWSHKVIYKADL
jgi:hypothetical protein